MEAPVSSPLRNLSLTSGKPNPDLPNRAPRPRLRAIRWIREPVDGPEIYPLGPGSNRRPPIRSCGPSRLGIHCLDQARLTVSMGPLEIYKEPEVVLSLVNDKAQLYLSGVSAGSYFAIWVVTSQMEKAIVSFEMTQGDSEPELGLSDAASQHATFAGGGVRPLVIVEDGALQQTAQAGEAHQPQIELEEQARQTTYNAAGEHVLPHTVQVEFEDKVQAAYALLQGDVRPMVFLNEPASQTIEQSDGEFLLKWRIQNLLEQIAQEVVLGNGESSSPGVSVTVADQAEMTVDTADGASDLPFPSDAMVTYVSGAQLNGLNGGTLWMLPYVARPSLSGLQVADPMDDYADADLVNGLNLGLWTDNPYVDRDNLNALANLDSLETYADLSGLNGLNGGFGFVGAYVDRENFAQVTDGDNFESYSVQAPVVDTLNAGAPGWVGPWVFSPVLYPNFAGEDDFQAYAVQNPVSDSLNSGSNWSGAWSVGGVPLNGSAFIGGGAADNFESYADENPVTSTLNDGSSWAGAWLIP